jgi:hypothetical protein
MTFRTDKDGSREVVYTVNGHTYSKTVGEHEERMLLRAIEYGRQTLADDLKKLLEVKS